MDTNRSAPSTLENTNRLVAFRAHSLRDPISDEIHNRPSASVSTPALVSHLAVMTSDSHANDAFDHLGALCKHYNIPEPQPGARHFYGDCGDFRIRWERHSEFTSYSIIHEGDFDDAFGTPALALVPESWLSILPGEVIAAVHVALTTAASSAEQLSRYFDKRTVISSQLSDGAATVWTDFQIHGDGFGRVLLQDLRLNERQSGRLIQRLVEIETYRTMSLLALPLAQELAPKVTLLDRQLADITEQMAEPMNHDNESRLLHELTSLAAQVERLIATSSYRFAASRAYRNIVNMRFKELRETRIQGFMIMREFLERRLDPAMRTCESIETRLETLSNRVSRASHLLRTRVDLELESQNSALLASMDRRARMQLRLQQTVEGLSVAAVSYYVVSLVGVLAKALQAGGLDVNADLAPGIALPIVVAVIWYGIRRARRHFFNTAPKK